MAAEREHAIASLRFNDLAGNEAYRAAAGIIFVGFTGVCDFDACRGIHKKARHTFCIVAAFIGEPSLAQQRHIPKAQLEEMFASIQTQTTWDVKEDMLWGYFFISTNKSELEKIGAELASNGYRLVEIRQLDSDAPQAAPECLLHVERIETHTVDTLFTSNTQFEDLASRYKDVIYDGMDVGPAI